MTDRLLRLKCYGNARLVFLCVMSDISLSVHQDGSVFIQNDSLFTTIIRSGKSRVSHDCDATELRHIKMTDLTPVPTSLWQTHLHQLNYPWDCCEVSAKSTPTSTEQVADVTRKTLQNLSKGNVSRPGGLFAVVHFFGLNDICP